MLIPFALKQTKPIDFVRPVEAYIMKQYQEPSLFEKVKSSLENAQKIRNSLDFDKVNISIATDVATQEKLEQGLLTYIRYTNIFKKRLRMEHQDQTSVPVAFIWGCSYNPVQMGQSSSINYEQAAIFYNLAITEYYLGSSKLLMETDQDRKQAISRLRNGAWAIQQSRALIPQLPTDIVNQHADYLPSNLDTLENSFFALSYKALYENISHNEKQFGAQNVASVLIEGSKYFQQALVSANVFKQQAQKKVKEQVLNQLIATLTYQNVWTQGLACLKLAQAHYARIPDESRGQNMGKALGFLVKAESGIIPILNDKNSAKVYSSFQLDSLKTLFGQIQTIKSDYVNRNNQIYKEQICQEVMLPFPPIPENLKIKALVPPVFNEKLQDEAAFEGFVSEEAIQLTKEIKQHVEKSKYQLDEAFKILGDQKSKAYQESFVYVFLDMLNSNQLTQSLQLPAAVKQKVDAIRNRGGITAAQKQSESVKTMSVECEQQLNQLKVNLEREQQEDQILRQQYQQLWRRQPSEQINKELLSPIIDLQQKLRVAQQIDFQVSNNLQNCIPSLKITELPDSEIALQIPRQNDNTDFISKNKALIEQLQQFDASCQQTQDQMRQLIFKFFEIINQTNFTQQAIQAINNGMNKSVVMTEAVNPFSQLIEQFNQLMSKASHEVTQACAIATQLQNSKRSQSSVSQQSPLLTGLNQSLEIYDNLDYGFSFYTSMKANLGDLDRKINDFLMARQFEKDDLLNQMKKGPGGGNQPKPTQNPQHQQQYSPYQPQQPPAQWGQPQPQWGQQQQQPQGYFYNPHQGQGYQPPK